MTVLAPNLVESPTFPRRLIFKPSFSIERTIDCGPYILSRLGY
ncbi:MAG: hypothetical protein WBK28_01750 [Minisyncoccia bacterium]